MRIILHNLLLKLTESKANLNELRALFVEHNCEDILNDFSSVFTEKKIAKKSRPVQIALSPSKSPYKTSTLPVELGKVYDSLRQCYITTLGAGTAVTEGNGTPVKKPQEVSHMLEVQIKRRLSELRQSFKNSVAHSNNSLHNSPKYKRVESSAQVC